MFYVTKILGWYYENVLQYNLIVEKLISKFSSPSKSAKPVGNPVIAVDETETEALLVEKAKHDVTNFRVLYEKYFKEIFGYVLYRIKDREETADITSQVFLKALLKINSFTYRGVPFSAWLYKIALNEVNQYFRKEKIRKVVIVDDAALKQISEQVEDENLMYRKEKLELLLQDLTPSEIDLLEMRFQLGRSHKEIACIINSSEANTRVKLHRLINKIKNKCRQ